MAAEGEHRAAEDASPRVGASPRTPDAGTIDQSSEDASAGLGPAMGTSGVAAMQAERSSRGSAEAALARTWTEICHWLRFASWLPPWLPARWRHWGVGYLAAVLLQAIAVGITGLVNGVFPSFSFLGTLEILIVVFVALSFGMGPSLLATLAGAILLDFVVLTPHFAWSLSGGENLTGLALFLIVGGVVSILPSQTERARGEAEKARRQAEEIAASLSRERARLDAIVEATPDRIAIFDTQGRILRLNAAAQQAAGPGRGSEGLPDFQQAYELRRLTGEPWPTDDLPLMQALRGEVVSGVEMLYRDAEGHVRSILSSAAPVRDADGRIQGAVAITHDVTALRETQQAAVERASQLEAILESMADGIFVYDQEGRILRTNDAARKLFALDTHSEYATLPLNERLPLVETRDAEGRPVLPDASPQRRVLRGEVLSGDTATDYLLRVLDGRDVMVNVTGTPVRSEDGKVYGGILILRDVTEQRRLLRRTRDALDAVLAMAQALVELPQDVSPDVVSEGEQAAAGDAAVPTGERAAAQRIAVLTCGVLGCARVCITAVEPETDRLRAIAVVGLPPEQERQWWAEQRELEARGTRLGEGGDPEELVRFRSGEIFVLDMTQPPFADLPNPYGVTTQLIAPMSIGGQLIGLLSLDYGGLPHTFTPDEIRLAGAVAQLGAVVLERDRLLRERARAQASLLAAQETNRRMDEFLSVAGHELRTPLTTAHVNAQLAERRIERLREEVEQADTALVERIAPLLDTLDTLVARMGSATKRQRRLVEDLLDVSRLQSGRLELRLETCDLIEIVRECVEEQQATQPDRVIKMELPDEPVFVTADADRAGQVVTNFLINALKYSPVSTPVTVTVVVGRPDAGAARVSVRDEGPGIAADELPHVWDRFHRVPGIEVQSGSGVGLGLGLYISYQIVERSGGEVGIESKVGAGSTFWFTLPLASARVAPGNSPRSDDDRVNRPKSTG